MKNKKTYLIYFITAVCCILWSNAVFSQEKADQLFEKALYIEKLSTAIFVTLQSIRLSN